MNVEKRTFYACKLGEKFLLLRGPLGDSQPPYWITTLHPTVATRFTTIEEVRTVLRANYEHRRDVKRDDGLGCKIDVSKLDLDNVMICRITITTTVDWEVLSE